MIDVCRVDREYVDGTIANEIMQDGARELRGETHVYGVESGAHYLDVYAPGAWIVRLAPLT